jgi:hypothetical protein
VQERRSGRTWIRPRDPSPFISRVMGNWYARRLVPTPPPPHTHTCATYPDLDRGPCCPIRVGRQAGKPWIEANRLACTARGARHPIDSGTVVIIDTTPMTHHIAVTPAMVAWKLMIEALRQPRCALPLQENESTGSNGVV